MEILDPFDIVVLLVLVVMTLWGGLRGVISQAAAILSLIAGWFAASNYYTIVEPYIGKNDTWSKPVAMLVMFIGTGVAIRIVAKIFQRFVSLSQLKEFDRQMGALFGFLKGAIICLLITYFAVTLSDSSRQAVVDSQSGPYLVRAVCALDSIMPEDVRHAFLKRGLDDFKTTAEESGLKTDTESLEEDVADLKKKLLDRVISPSAKDQYVSAEDSGSNTVASSSGSPQKSSAKKQESKTSSFFHGLFGSSAPATAPAASGSTPNPAFTGSDTKSLDNLVKDIAQDIPGVRVNVNSNGGTPNLQIEFMSQLPNQQGSSGSSSSGSTGFVPFSSNQDGTGNSVYWPASPSTPSSHQTVAPPF
ncbi:MAG: CvpA family protein [Planctomycetia bacterium]|nr:CvpA family protein [Planctomycetia bacterium]